jgi:hypothetical protein
VRSQVASIGCLLANAEIEVAGQEHGDLQSPRAQLSLPIGRAGPVKVLYMVGPDNESKRGFLEGYVDKQYVAVEEIDGARPLLPQWDELESKVTLTLFKLHTALAAPNKPVNQSFLCELDELYVRNQARLDEMAVVPLAGEKLLADRFRMMKVLEEVCFVVSGAFARIHGSDTPMTRSSELLEPIAHGAHICAVPFFKDVTYESFLKGYFDTGSLSGHYPFVVKPRDSSNHADMALVFDPSGLTDFVKTIAADFRAEEFISHSGRMSKIFVLDHEIMIGERNSLPDITGTSPVELKKYAATIDGKYLPEASGVGYVLFDSKVLTKGRNRTGNNLAPAKPLDEVSNLIPEVISFIVEALSQKVGTQLFGFDVLVDSKTGRYFLCDCNVFPGYNQWPDADARLRKYLIQRAAQMAVKEDSIRLEAINTIRQICIMYLPDWNEDDDIEVLPIEIKSNQVLRVLNKAPRVASPPSVIYRLFGREGFGPKGIIENKLVRDLSSRKVGAGWIADIKASYFGMQIHLGRIEELLPGEPLGSVLTNAHPFSSPQCFEDICWHVGNKLAGLHGLLGEGSEPADGQLERNTSFIGTHFPTPHVPKVKTRLRKWRLVAEHAMHTSGLRTHPIWSPLFDKFRLLVEEIDQRERQCYRRLQTEAAKATVFGHFDPNLGNLMVQGAGGRVVDVHLIDFEWAGPNVAVYDFAKFATSMRMKVSRDASCPIDEVQLRAGLRRMAQAYLGADGGAGADVGLVDSFVQDVETFCPVVAAVNLFSNIIHASKEGQLGRIWEDMEEKNWSELAELATDAKIDLQQIEGARDAIDPKRAMIDLILSTDPSGGHGIPPVSDYWFEADGGAGKSFNWLAHAQAHMNQYDRAVASMRAPSPSQELPASAPIRRRLIV